MKQQLFLISFFCLVYFLLSAPSQCFDDGLTSTLSAVTVEYEETTLASGEQVLSNVQENEKESKECRTGRNICEVRCSTVTNCDTDKVFQPILTGFFKNGKERNAYNKVCNKRGNNQIKGLTYIDRGTPFSNRFRALISQHFPSLTIDERMKKIDSDWYYVQALIIKNRENREFMNFAEFLFILSDIKYMYHGVQSFCLKTPNWRKHFQESLTEIEQETLFQRINIAVNRYKFVKARHPQSLKSTLYDQFVKMKLQLQQILKKLIERKKFSYCPCADLIIYDKVNNLKQSGAKKLKELIKKECGCPYLPPTARKEEPLGYVVSVFYTDDPNQGAIVKVSPTDKLTDAQRDPTQLEEKCRKGKCGRKGYGGAQSDQDARRMIGIAHDAAKKHHRKGGRKG